LLVPWAQPPAAQQSSSTYQPQPAGPGFPRAEPSAPAKQQRRHDGEIERVPGEPVRRHAIQLGIAQAPHDVHRSLHVPAHQGNGSYLVGGGIGGGMIRIDPVHRRPVNPRRLAILGEHPHDVRFDRVHGADMMDEDTDRTLFASARRLPLLVAQTLDCRNELLCALRDSIRQDFRPRCHCKPPAWVKIIDTDCEVRPS